MDTPGVTTQSPKKWIYLASALSIGAGIIHIAVAPAYFALWAGYGLFFAFAVAAQFMYAILLWVYPSLWGDHPSPTLLWAGILGNAPIVVMWLITRTIGIPFFGPAAWQVEPVGVLDSLAVLAELGTIASLVMILRDHPVRQPESRQSPVGTKPA